MSHKLGLMGDRIVGTDNWMPGRLVYDLMEEHSKIIDGATLQAIQEIEGEMPSKEILAGNLSKVLADPGADYLYRIYWRGRPILEVYPPEFEDLPISVQSQCRIKHRIRQLWKGRDGKGRR